MLLPVRVPVRVVTAQVAATILREVTKFMLYFQRQSPGPYDEMVEIVHDIAEMNEADQGSRAGAVRVRRRKTRHKRLLQFVQHSKALFHLLEPHVLVESRVTDVMLILGASAARPKMAVQLVLGPRGVVTESASVDPAVLTKQAADCARRVLRALIQSAADMPMASGPTKLLVLVRAPSDSPPPEFLPKRTFKPHWKFGRKVFNPLQITLDCDGRATRSLLESHPLEDSDAPADLLWYQCRVAVKGMPAG